jgi:GNAT superfamily N-acetyltransferase
VRSYNEGEDITKNWGEGFRTGDAVDTEVVMMMIRDPEVHVLVVEAPDGRGVVRNGTVLGVCCDSVGAGAVKRLEGGEGEKIGGAIRILAVRSDFHGLCVGQRLLAKVSKASAQEGAAAAARERAQEKGCTRASANEGAAAAARERAQKKVQLLLHASERNRRCSCCCSLAGAGGGFGGVPPRHPSRLPAQPQTSNSSSGNSSSSSGGRNSGGGSSSGGSSGGSSSGGGSSSETLCSSRSLSSPVPAVVCRPPLPPQKGMPSSHPLRSLAQQPASAAERQTFFALASLARSTL